MSETEQTVDPRRTWLNQELELLVSGAVVFSLFQLASGIEQWWLNGEGSYSCALDMSFFMIYYIGTLITYGLVVAFVGHLLLRGLWVGLLGLRAAFPEGINWDKIELGSSLREFYQKRKPNLGALEARVDVIASSIFAFLFLFVFIMLLISFWFLVIFGISLLISKIIPFSNSNDYQFVIVVCALALLVLPSLLITTVDRMQRSEKWKQRVPGWLERFVNRMLPVMSFVTLAKLSTPVLLTFISYIPRRRMSIMLVVFVYFLLGIFLVSTLVKRDVITLDSYIYLPVKGEADEFRPEFYDNLNTNKQRRVPSIASDIADERYLRLFIPYDAKDDNQRIEKLCPEVEPLTGAKALFRGRNTTKEARRQSTLDCLGKIYEVSLDGETISPDWLFARHPDSGERGRIAYLPSHEYTPGKHLLVIRHTLLPGMSEDEDEDRDEFFIPFWR